MFADFGLSVCTAHNNTAKYPTAAAAAVAVLRMKLLVRRELCIRKKKHYAEIARTPATCRVNVLCSKY